MPAESNRLELELLALRCRRGERAAWEELVARWQRPLLYYVRRMVASEDDAWQVLQDTWLRVFSSLPTLTDPARLAPWLYSIARNALRAHGSDRAEQRNAEAELDEHMDLHTDLEVALDAERVHVALQHLSPPQREVLTLFFLEDLTLQEIADVLEIPVGTVKSRSSKARGTLREVLLRMEARHV